MHSTSVYSVFGKAVVTCYQVATLNWTPTERREWFLQLRKQPSKIRNYIRDNIEGFLLVAERQVKEKVRVTDMDIGCALHVTINMLRKAFAKQIRQCIKIHRNIRFSREYKNRLDRHRTKQYMRELPRFGLAEMVSVN